MQIGKLLPLLILMFITGLFLPWWAFTLISVALAYFTSTKKELVFVAFISGALYWGLLLIYQWQWGGKILFNRISEMMLLPHPLLLISISAILSGILAVFSALSGYYIKNIFHD